MARRSDTYLRVCPLAKGDGYGCTLVEGGTQLVTWEMEGYQPEQGIAILARRMALPIRVVGLGPERTRDLALACYGEDVEVLR